MRLRQALALVTFMALCGCLGASATRNTTPTCKTGQVSTKAHPCVRASSKTVDAAPIAPNAKPVPQQQLVTQVADPGDTGARVGATDADTVVHFLDPMRGLYQIEVFNTSGIGFINTFNWVPPPNM